MDSTILVAFITAVGSIIGTVVTGVTGILVALVGKIQYDKIASRRKREALSIPDITKTRWEASWYLKNGALYVSDIVTFDNWVKDTRFSGYGEVTHGDKQYKYSIEGEITLSRIVVFTYKAERYPTEANVGMACLELSDGAEDLEGVWAGRVDEKLQSGKVEMRRVK